MPLLSRFEKAIDSFQSLKKNTHSQTKLKVIEHSPEIVYESVEFSVMTFLKAKRFRDDSSKMIFNLSEISETKLVNSMFKFCKKLIHNSGALFLQMHVG